MSRRRRPRPWRSPRKKKRRPRPQPEVSRIPDTPTARLEDEVRKDVEVLVKHRGKGHGLTEEERLLDRILEQHPEHLEDFQRAGEWEVTGGIGSPFVHVGLHRIVERRVVSREIERLDPSKDWHDAVHEEAILLARKLLEGLGPETPEPAGAEAE